MYHDTALQNEMARAESEYNGRTYAQYQEDLEYMARNKDRQTDIAVALWRECAASREGAGEAMLEKLNICAEHFGEMVVHLLAKDRQSHTSFLQAYLQEQIIDKVYAYSREAAGEDHE